MPKSVREKILREHADASRRDIATTVRNINRQKQQRRKTVVNIPMASTEEKIEKVKRGIKKMVGARSSYTKEEAKLWDEAHAVAMEKARRLEESIRNGEKLSMREVYKVGTPWNNVVPSEKNSGRTANADKAESHSESKQYDSTLNINAMYKPTRRVSIDSSALEKSERVCSKSRIRRFDQNFRHSDSDLTMSRHGAKEIIVSESDNDVDDIFNKLMLDSSVEQSVEHDSLSSLLSSARG